VPRPPDAGRHFGGMIIVVVCLMGSSKANWEGP